MITPHCRNSDISLNSNVFHSLFLFILILLFLNNFNKSSDDDDTRYYESMPSAGPILKRTGADTREWAFIQSLFSELYKALETQRVCEFELPLLQAWEPFLSSPFCICALSIHSSNVARYSLVSLEAWLKAKKGGCCTCLFFFTLHSIVISLKKGKIQTSKNINKPGKEK